MRGRWLRYTLTTQTPVLITDLSRSGENSYETRGYIPGSAVRGMVMSALAAQVPEWFRANRQALLSDGTRFLDAVPAPVDGPVLPAIRGFYETKEETGLESVVVNGAFTPGKKRARTGRRAMLSNSREKNFICWPCPPDHAGGDGGALRPESGGPGGQAGGGAGGGPLLRHGVGGVRRL